MDRQSTLAIQTRLRCLLPPPIKHFVVASDEIKEIDTSTLPVACVVNADPISLPGSHWIALYIYSRR